MKQLLTFILISLCTGIIDAKPLTLPDLWIEAEHRRLKLTKVSIDVTLQGAIAETVLELEYYNEGNRNAEGEFIMQLPPGATVSTYALEVNGKMRPGVSVEKNQARNAYLSIKARNVDPGLVEREAGNIYRTRIFPIFPRKTKKVRIGFIHSIPDGNYQYQFARKTKIGSFSCRVTGTVDGMPVIKLGKTQAQLGEEFQTTPWTKRDVSLEGELTCRSIIAKQNIQTRFDLDTKGNLYFISQGQLAENTVAKKWNDWKEITLVWDVSRSGKWRDHEMDFKAISQILKKIGDCTVNTYQLNDQLSKPTKIEIKAGDPTDLIKHLKQSTYEGVADFSKISDLPGRVLIFSDGKAHLPSLGITKTQTNSERYLFHTSPDPISSYIAMELAGIYDIRHSYADHIDFRTDDWNRGNWFYDFESGRTGMLKTNLARHLWDFRRRENQFIISGKIPKNAIENVELKLPDGTNISVAEHLESANQNEWNLSRRVWAEQRLLNLEKTHNVDKITNFAISERLVSDYTSLIVLEIFEDHLRYNIPPPEPELLKKYHQIKNSPTGAQQSLNLKWSFKKEWHYSPFRWFDFDLSDVTEKIRIWTSSTEKVFTSETVNQKTTEEYQSWLESEKKLTLKRNQIESNKQFKDWLKSIESQLDALEKIRTETPTEDSENQVHVSVRGTVKYRGIFSGQAPYTLEKALDSAEVNSVWDRQNVYIYRAHERIGYNLLNPSLGHVPLKWGDMIVVEGIGYRGRFGAGGGGGAAPFGAADAFAAADPFAPEPVPSSPATGPAIFRDDAPVKTNLAPKRQQDDSPQNEQTNITYSSDPKTSTLDSKFYTQLKASNEPLNLYNDAIAQKVEISLNDIIEISRVFFAKGDHKNGTRILINLLDFIPHPIEAIRSYAYWLAEFGQIEKAEKILNERLTAGNLDHRTRALLHFDIGQITGKADAFKQSVIEESKSDDPSGLVTIALTDAFSRGSEAIMGNDPYIMESDYRVVITAMGQSFNFGVDIPKKFRGFTVDHSANEVMAAGVAEHQSIKALPGVVEVNLLGAEPGTYHIVIYRNFGRENETIETKKTILVEEDIISETVGEIDFIWKDIEVDLDKHLQKDPFNQQKFDRFAPQENDPFGF